jgi:hypothetical protein
MHCRPAKSHSDAAPMQMSSPQQSLSLNPASGSHSQASPDALNPDIPELSDAQVHMHGTVIGDGNFELSCGNMHGNESPHNVSQQTETTENTGGSSHRNPRVRDSDFACSLENVPSPGSQPNPKEEANDSAGACLPRGSLNSSMTNPTGCRRACNKWNIKGCCHV